jgi:hypothetical protein
MVKTVRQLCEPHESSFTYVIGDQVERLEQVADATSGESESFFQKNHITAGLKVLLQEGLLRLSGRSGQALFELRQAMGGGKTHSMVALGLLARDPSLRHRILPSGPKGFDAARIVVIDGRSVDRRRHIWGDIIVQLARSEIGSVHWKDGPKPPSKKEWIEYIGQEPTLVLLDELPPYLDYAVAVGSGEGNLGRLAKYALSNLFAAALELPRCCIVVSSLSGTYAGASEDLHDLANEASRQARSLTPVDLGTDEIYQILRKRLFKQVDLGTDLSAVVDAFRTTINQAVLSQALPSTARQIVDEIPQTYPFHPSVKHVIALFRNNETFRQTRGLMQLASRMLLSTWRRPTDDVYLIGCQHLDLGIQEVRDDLNRIRDLQGAVAHDIFDSGASIAERIDAELGGDYARQVCSLLLTASLSSAVDAVQGFTQDQLLEYLISPSAGPREIVAAFERLYDDAWYLHRNQSQAWYFSPAENLRKLIEDRAQNAPQPKIEAEMRRRLTAALKPRGRGVYQRIEALPKINDVDLRGDRICVILEPEPGQPTDSLRRYYEAVTEKNNLCVVTGDGSRFADLERAVRRAYGTTLAREQMAHNQPDKLREAEDLANEAEQAVNSTVTALFNKVIFPTRDGLAVTPLQFSPAGAKDRGEEEIGEALASTGAQKFVRDFDAEADALIIRAEDMLWPSSERRARWADIEEKARINPRWKWLEPKGLVRLRERAKGQGRWRDHNDGWIEKGPFPKEKTSVTVITEHYNDRTGEAHVNARPSHAGKVPQVFYGPRADVSPTNGTLLAGEVLKTEETALWFVAIDPDGKHETGPPVRWQNQLTITHDVQTLPDGRRRVTLALRPDITKRAGGALRWNTQGINPKDGQPYMGEIIIGSPAEAKVWAFAAHEGVEQTKTFIIPAANAEGPVLIYDQPATLSKRWSVAETAESFGVMKSVKEKGARLSIAKLTVGEGEKHIMLRFGSGVSVEPETLESLVRLARQALRDDLAKVALDVNGIAFATGRDLEDFLKEHAVQARPEEITQ